MRRRGGWSLWAGIIYAVILVAVTVGLGSFYHASKERLDQAMGDRLLAVARSVALLLDGSLVADATLGDPQALAELNSLQVRLEELEARNDLAEVTVCTPEGVVLISTAGSLQRGAPNDYWQESPAAVEMALGGIGKATRLYRLDDSFRKSAHAPVWGNSRDDGKPLVVAVVTVSGRPDFFQSLATLRRGALITGVAVLLILIVLGVFLHRINLSLERYRASMLRQENLAAMGRMTAGIAHEIRNPLGIIRGTGQHLQRVLADAGIEDEMAEFIPEEVDRLDQILTGYLAFGTDRPADGELFDLMQTARRGIRLLEDELREYGVTVAYRDPAVPALVYGDPRRLQQVILNLLLNARDAMPTGGAIDVDLRIDGNQGVLIVADEGDGLAGADPESLFEPFHTSKEKGSGLGLALSRRIAVEMGGTLVLRDGSSGGAEAELRLPLSDTNGNRKPRSLT